MYPSPQEEEESAPLAVEHIFSVDPLQLDEEDLTTLVQYLRESRLNFLAKEARPKTVKKSRSTIASADVSKLLDSILDEELPE